MRSNLGYVGGRVASAVWTSRVGSGMGRGAKGTVSSKRTKHWDLYLHMNKQRVRDGTTEPDRVPSPDNNSDVGTKCQNDPDYLRLTPRLKGYAESYIPPAYNLLMGPLTDHAFG